MSLLAAIVLSQAAAAPVDCDTAFTQMDMNWCAAQDFAKADDELNAQWAITGAEMRRRDAELAAMDDGVGRERSYGYYAQVVAAQRAWLNFRDAHCDTVGYQAHGGSMEPMLVAMCRAALTRDRTLQLRELLQP